MTIKPYRNDTAIEELRVLYASAEALYAAHANAQPPQQFRRLPRWGDMSALARAEWVAAARRRETRG